MRNLKTFLCTCLLVTGIASTAIAQEKPHVERDHLIGPNGTSCMRAVGFEDGLGATRWVGSYDMGSETPETSQNAGGKVLDDNARFETMEISTALLVACGFVEPAIIYQTFGTSREPGFTGIKFQAGIPKRNHEIIVYTFGLAGDNDFRNNRVFFSIEIIS